MKIIITGSDSQLAQSIRLLDFNKNIDFFFFDKKSLNISNHEELSNKFSNIQPDIVINCAAYTDVKKAEYDHVNANEINNLSLINLSKISNQYNSLLIHFSTDYVFDGFSNKKYMEDDIVNPISIYGKSKSLGEKQIIKLCNNFLIFRVSWLFSKYNNNFVDFVLNNLKQNKDIMAISDLRSVPTYATEIAFFIKFFIENYKNETYSNIYHFNCGGSDISWYEFAMKISKIYSKYNNSFSNIIKTNSYDFFRNNIRPKFSAMSNKKFTDHFNFKINTWQNSIEELVLKKL